MEKRSRAGEAPDDDMAHSHGMLDTQGYKHTLRISNPYCFTTATVVIRTRHSVSFIRTLPVLLISSIKLGATIVIALARCNKSVYAVAYDLLLFCGQH